MTKLTPKEITSIVLAFILLLCLFPLPYGFFVFIRLITTIVFGYFAYDFYQRGETTKCIVAALIVLLFQPFAKITFEREIWNVIDIIVALLLFGHVIWERVKGMSAASAPPTIQMSSAHSYDVFISYSSKDYYDLFGNPQPQSVISDLLTSLEDAGITYWIDTQGLSGGTVFPQEIAKQIYNCKVFLFVSTHNSNQSTWTMNEIATANNYGKNIIPLRADDTQFAPPIMIYIAGLQYINYYLNPTAAKRQLVNTIRQIINQQ
jgi:hypothetical protein